jgi:[protein-PII] uridylyltransferase
MTVGLADYSALAQRRTIIDRRALAEEIAALTSEGDMTARRAALVRVLKAALAKGRAEITRRMLEEGARGKALTAAHAYLIDQILRLLFDTVTERFYPRLNPTRSERLALLAVGGYGRAEMAPFSDVDILFLTPYKQTPWGEQVIESMLYALWDTGLKVGQATRSLAEMTRIAKEDLTVRTALLEARYLWGDQDLYAEARAIFYKEVVAGTASQFIADKLAERDARHKRMGDSRYVVEPNIKDGKGGLRDLHTLFWIGKYVYRVSDIGELVDKGLFTRDELRTFEKAADFLWTVRCHLHDLSRRAEERLTFDVQPELAKRLGYADRAGASGVERFMKHYFLTAKQVGDLTRLFLTHLEEGHTKRPLWRLPTLRRRPRNLEGFVLEGHRLTIPKSGFFREDPVRLLRYFYLIDQNALEPHPDAMREASRDVGLIGPSTRQNVEANRLFLEMLTSRKSPEATLRWMNEAGVFGRFVPDFGRVVAQMQFDMYHQYTVDEHTIRAIGLVAQIEAGTLAEDHPLATAVIQKLASRRVLYAAVLLHDIAKGRNGDHSVLGAEIAERLCPRFGMSAAETETVAWLVRWHLLMSATAFKRDLADFKTILDFAEQVQSPERLRLLLVLTVVDIRAVGPGVWNSWKGQLLQELFEAAEEVLLVGHKQSGRKERIAAKQARLGERLGWPAATFAKHARRLFDAYWIAETDSALERNALLIRAADKDKSGLTVDVSKDAETGATHVTVYTADHPGLFYRIAGAIALANANIVGAKIHTTRDGMALDNLTIQDANDGGFGDPEQLVRVRRTIEDVLSGKVRLFERLNAKPLPRARMDAFRIEPAVFLDNRASNRYTVIEINALDRPALLYALTHALYQAKVTIHSAHVATFGERAVDVFYVTDLTGDKIINAMRLKALERRLIAAALGKSDDGEHSDQDAAARAS